MVIDVGALYAEHYGAICGFLRRRVADDETAEDLAADVFVRIVEKADRYEDRGIPPRAWVHRIARRRLSDHYRLPRVTTEPLDAKVPGGRATIDAGSDRHAEQLTVSDALARLPESWQHIVIEFSDGASSRAIGRRRNVCHETIRKTRSKAYQRLRQIMGSVA